MEEGKLLKRKERAQREQNLELLSSTIKKLAEYYDSQGLFEEALNAYEEQRELCLNMGQRIVAARADRFMGEIYCNMGEYKDALRKLKEYLDIAAEEKDLIEEQRALATIGRTYFFMSTSLAKSNEAEYKRSLREAKQAYMSSLKICDKITNVNRHELLLMRSRLLLNLGLVFDCQDDFEKAVEHIQMAITINVKADFYEDSNLCYTSMASLYLRQGNTALALKYYDLAIEVAERLPNKLELMSEELCNKADVYFSVANFKAAKQTLIRAYRMCRGTLEDKPLIEKKLKLAHVLCESENKLISMSDTDQNAMKEVYETMGDACCGIKNFNQAIVYYQKMLECCETLGCCGKELLPAITSLSVTCKDAGKYEESLKFYQKELDIQDDNPEEACKTSLNIVRVLELKQAEYSEIMKNLRKSHDYAVIANNEELEIKVLRHMLKLQEKYGFAEDANETRNKIDAILADVSSLGSSSDTSEEEDGTPELINSISMSDILDDSELNSVEVSRPRQLRRQQKSFKITRNDKGETPLQVACIKGDIAQVKRFIDRKHPINVVDNGGWSPLHEVCNLGHEQLVKLLLDNGANINDPGGDGSEGITPLHDACSNGHLRIVKILLDRGASADVRTDNNKTPLDFLLEWASRNGPLSEEQTRLFETIKEKLQSDLEKVGVSTESVKVPVVQHTKIQEPLIFEDNKPKKNRISSKTRLHTGKRGWSDSSSESSCRDYNSGRDQSKEPSDDETVDTAVCEISDDSNSGSLAFTPGLIEDPTLEYQQVMKGLRKRVVQEHPTKLSKAKIGALIGDSEVVDDWLIDDLKDQTRPNKRRRTRDEIGGAKLIGTLRKDVVIEGDRSETDFMELEELPYEHEEITQQCNKPSNEKKRSYQSSLLDSGIVSVSEVSARQNNALSHSVVESDACIPSVKIHIEDTSLLVPILCHERGKPLTIDWLAKEAASRFLKLDGREPLLVLLTSDGAKLAADDPVTVINDRELTGQITGWKTVSLRQRYETACSALGSACDQLIKNRVQDCDTTHCLNLNDCIFNLNCLNPLIQSLQHEHSLRELLLGSNALTDAGIQILSTMKGLPLLEVCDLKCNNITSVGLPSLCEFLSHCQSLKILDLSFNDFEDGWLASIHRVCKYLKALTSLNLKACDMCGDEFLSWEETEPALNNLKHLETLDISDNPLGEHGVHGFLCHLNSNKIRKLCLSKTASVSSKCVSKIVQFFQRESPLNLRYLDISDCDITDSELMEILRCLKPAEHLTTLLLCNNSELSLSSLEALMNMPNVPQTLDLCGCDSLFSSDNDESNDVLVNNEFLEKLNSLTMSGLPELESTKHWSDRFDVCWKQIWGYRGKVLKGPSGLLKFEVSKIEEQ